MELPGFGRRAAWAIFALAVAVIVTLLGARYYTTVVADERSAKREEALVTNGLKGWVLEVEGRVVGQTTWDDAVQHIGVAFDRGWISENIGKFLHDAAHFETAIVLDAADQPRYVMDRGKDVPIEASKWSAGVARPLVAEVRRRERLRLAAPARRAGDAMTAPIQASAFGLVRERPSIVTATLVQPDFRGVRLPRAPIIVTVETLDEGFQVAFGHRFLLTGLHIHPDVSGGAEPLEARSALRDGHGQVVAFVDWTPARPAHALFLKTLPVLLLAIAMFSGVAFALFIRGRRAAQALLASEIQAKHMAYHDFLTGLPNRALFADRLAHGLAELRRSRRPVGVLTLDLDKFKQVNDTYGHAAGDELIVDIGRRLKALARDTDVVARLGGDEFAILCLGASPRGLARLADRIVQMVAQPVDLPFARVFLGASIGVTLTRDPAVDAVEVMRQADVAMYQAKTSGRGRFQFYEPEMDRVLKSRQALEQDLRSALAEDALAVVYQPQVDGTGRVTGVEALVRWNHPVRGAVSPSFFVAVAEECGLIQDLGDFVLRRAFADSLRWPKLKVAVNISAVQLRRADFPALVESVLAATGADPARLELEITEGILLGDDAGTQAVLGQLRAMGFSLSLDDFGTGYSSLAYLQRYPIDRIKIDRSFVVNLGCEKEAEAVVRAIVRLARALSLDVIAEGVETPEQRASLRRAGCVNIQGYLFSPPVAADEVAPICEAARRGERGDAVAA